MDLITHALLGAAAAVAVTGAPAAGSPAAGSPAAGSPAAGAPAAGPSASRRFRAWYALAGGLTALLPDLDVLIRSSEDPLLTLQFHRHFTHSLILAPLAAALAAAILRRPLGRLVTLARLYGACVAGYLSACLLDACTSYGTHLFWPISDEPVALGIIAVVDPLFTLLLSIGLVMAWRTGKIFWTHASLVLACAYLVLGAWQQHRAWQAADVFVRGHGMVPERLLVKPTLGNVLLWRTIAVAGGQAQVNAVRVGWSSRPLIYPGGFIALVEPQQQTQVPLESRAGRDLLRFHRFAGGLVVADADTPGFFGDLRYGLLPTDVRPLWGIQLGIHPNATPQFVTRRTTSPAQRQALLAMLRGSAPEDLQKK